MYTLSTALGDVRTLVRGDTFPRVCFGPAQTVAQTEHRGPPRSAAATWEREKAVTRARLTPASLSLWRQTAIPLPSNRSGHARAKGHNVTGHRKITGGLTWKVKITEGIKYT